MGLSSYLPWLLPELGFIAGRDKTPIVMPMNVHDNTARGLEDGLQWRFMSEEAIQTLHDSYPLQMGIHADTVAQVFVIFG
jgi:hypothetical protein